LLHRANPVVVVEPEARGADRMEPREPATERLVVAGPGAPRLDPLEGEERLLPVPERDDRRHPHRPGAEPLEAAGLGAVHRRGPVAARVLEEDRPAVRELDPERGVEAAAADRARRAHACPEGGLDRAQDGGAHPEPATRWARRPRHAVSIISNVVVKPSTPP